MLIGQEPLSYQCLDTTESFETDVPFSDLEKLENDIENMFKVMEKHLETNNEDEKVGSRRFSKLVYSLFFAVNYISTLMFFTQMSATHDRTDPNVIF